jgi:hypothetical protein
MVIMVAVVSLAIMFLIVVLYSCIKAAARADRMVEAFLLREEEHSGSHL